MWLCHSCFQGMKGTSPSLETRMVLWPKKWGRSHTMWHPILASKNLAAYYSHSLGKMPWDCHTKKSGLACLRMASQGEQRWLLPPGLPEQPANHRHQPLDMWLRHLTPHRPGGFLMVSHVCSLCHSFLFSFNVAARCGNMQRLDSPAFWLLIS